MTPEQQEFWNALSYNPSSDTHSLAQDMISMQGTRRFHREVDRCIIYVMHNFTREDILRAFKTWLSVYRLPFNPDKLKTFDYFHSELGEEVNNRASNQIPINPF